MDGCLSSSPALTVRKKDAQVTPGSFFIGVLSTCARLRSRRALQRSPMAQNTRESSSRASGADRCLFETKDDRYDGIGVHFLFRGLPLYNNASNGLGDSILSCSTNALELRSLASSVPLLALHAALIMIVAGDDLTS